VSEREGGKKRHNLASHSQKQPTLFSFFIEERRADEFIDRRKSRPGPSPCTYIPAGFEAPHQQQQHLQFLRKRMKEETGNLQ
jgi:hypothetical protein